MTTREAIQAMIDGKKVRGTEWENGYYVTFVDNVGFIDENLAITDITIEDKWEIYEEPEQKQVVVIEKWLLREINGRYETKETSDVDDYIDGYWTKVKLLDTYEVEL